MAGTRQTMRVTRYQMNKQMFSSMRTELLEMTRLYIGMAIYLRWGISTSIILQGVVHFAILCIFVTPLIHLDTYTDERHDTKGARAQLFEY